MKEREFISKIKQIESTIREKGDGGIAKITNTEIPNVTGFIELRKELENVSRMCELISSPEVDAHLPKEYLDLFLKHAEFCKVRPRPVGHAFDGKMKTGGGQCHTNALLVSEETGMRLFTGYATPIGSDRSYWHVWNVDAQGYVYDSTYQERTYRMVYYGIEVDPYKAGQVLKIYELEKGDLSDESYEDYKFMLYIAQGFYILRHAEKIKRTLPTGLAPEVYEAALDFIQPNSEFDAHLYKNSSTEK